MPCLICISMMGATETCAPRLAQISSAFDALVTGSMLICPAALSCQRVQWTNVTSDQSVPLRGSAAALIAVAGAGKDFRRTPGKAQCHQLILGAEVRLCQPADAGL